jgi:putative aminopeptidase FrvX
MDMTTAELIREYLNMHSNGGFTDDIYNYCITQGALFDTPVTVDQKKSISGQLSKMRDAGRVTYERRGRRYLWKIIK